MSRSAALAVLGAFLAADPAAMLERADASHDAFGEGVIQLRVVVDEAGKTPVTARIDLYVKGNDKSLCLFREGKQAGRRILTVGDRVWLIVPTAGKAVPVSKSQRLMGAASFGDIAQLRFADTYQAALRAELEDGCHVLDLTAKRKGAAYPTGVLWIGQADGLARRLRLSLASGKDAKEVRFDGYDANGRVGTMAIRDLLAAKSANVTTLTFTHYEKREVDPSIFTPEGAREVP